MKGGRTSDAGCSGCGLSGPCCGPFSRASTSGRRRSIGMLTSGTGRARVSFCCRRLSCSSSEHPSYGPFGAGCSGCGLSQPCCGPSARGVPHGICIQSQSWTGCRPKFLPGNKGDKGTPGKGRVAPSPKTLPKISARLSSLLLSSGCCRRLSCSSSERPSYGPFGASIPIRIRDNAAHG